MTSTKPRPTGDGLAVVAPRFMDWSGERVPPTPAAEPRFDGWTSTLHRHSGECLEEIIGGVRLMAHHAGDREMPEPGWVRCAANGVRYHRHGDRLMAHHAGDRAACPDGARA